MTSKRVEKKKTLNFEWHSSGYQFTLIKLIKNADQCNNNNKALWMNTCDKMQTIPNTRNKLFKSVFFLDSEKDD